MDQNNQNNQNTELEVNRRNSDSICRPFLEIRIFKGIVEEVI